MQLKSLFTPFFRDFAGPKIKGLTEERDILAARVAELTAQVRTLSRLDSIASIPKVPKPKPHSARPSKRSSKFVLFSNPRSGSTWLETMLGLLPDVYVDYELKWGVTYRPSDIHAVLSEKSETISQVLENLDSKAPVVGSKFVFDSHGLTPLDFSKLTAKIGPDVRIVHLTRSYQDIFLSIRRGFHHAPVRTNELSNRLREALNSADIRQALPETAHEVAPLVCFKELYCLLENDLHAHSLHATGLPYMQISYDEVAVKLTEIAEFIGSRAGPDLVADVVARPAVAKLPPFIGKNLVVNLDELEPLFEAFEKLRSQLVPPMSAADLALPILPSHTDQNSTAL